MMDKTQINRCKMIFLEMVMLFWEVHFFPGLVEQQTMISPNVEVWNVNAFEVYFL